MIIEIAEFLNVTQDQVKICGWIIAYSLVLCVALGLTAYGIERAIRIGEDE